MIYDSTILIHCTLHTTHYTLCTQVQALLAAVNTGDTRLVSILASGDTSSREALVDALSGCGTEEERVSGLQVL
jgi:hypothetical protein